MSNQNLGLPASPVAAKAQAKRLRNALSPNLDIGHGQALELIARVHGEPSWGRLNSLIEKSEAVQLPTASLSKPEPNSKALPASGTKLEQRAMSALLKGLENARNTVPTSKTKSTTTKLLKNEIIHFISLEEWLDTLDTNLGGMVFDMGADVVVKLSGATHVSRYKRPNVNQTEVYANQGLLPASFAAVLIWLERLGFDTHPEVFYERFLPQIKKTSLLDGDELSCLWHAREKKKFNTFEKFYCDDVVTDPEDIVFDGRNGLKIRAVRSKDPMGKVAKLNIFR